MSGLYSNRLQVPIKELSADWIPEEGELFQDSSHNLYMGDNVTASNALTPINGGGTTTFTPEGLYLAFTDAVTSGDPGGGVFKFNSATVGSITKLYVSTIDQNSASTVAWLNLCTSGVLKVNKPEGGMMQFSVSRMVNQTTHFEFDVTHKFGTLPAVGNCYVDFTPDAPGVRRYEAHFNQQGTANPTLTVITDSFGEAVSFVRAAQGTYTLTIPSIVDITTVDVIIGAQQAENQSSGNYIRPYYNVSGSSINGYDITDGTVVDFDMAAAAYFHIKLTF